MEDQASGLFNTVVRMDAIAVLRPHRRLLGDDETEEFRDLARNLNDEGVSCLVVSLADVDWVNSAGLGAVVDAYQRFAKRGAHVHVNLVLLHQKAHALDQPVGDGARAL